MGFERDEVPSQGTGAAPLPSRGSAQLPPTRFLPQAKELVHTPRNPKMGFERDEVPSQGAGAAPLPGRGSAQIPFHAIFAAGKRARASSRAPLHKHPFFLHGRHCCLPLFVCKPSLTSLLPAAAASPSLSSVFKNAFYIFEKCIFLSKILAFSFFLIIIEPMPCFLQSCHGAAEICPAPVQPSNAGPSQARLSALFAGGSPPWH